MKKIALWLFLLTIGLITANQSISAPLRNFPITITQPNGVAIDCFVSGDEFFNWIHDKEERTIIQDSKTGYYVYAALSGDSLVSSGVVVGTGSSNKSAILPHILPSDETIGKIRKQRSTLPSDVLKSTSLQPGSTSASVGTIHNLVVFIKFADDPDFKDSLGYYNNLFNSTGSNMCMQDYFKETSYNKFDVSTHFLPYNSTTIVSYRDAFNRKYYQPYNASTNNIGFSDANKTSREHTLLYNAIQSVSANIPTEINLDNDGDGNVDNVCFIVYGKPDGWNDLLWPHAWVLYSNVAKINSKKVYRYNFQLSESLKSSGVGVLCHEMQHTIGAPDLYHYNSSYSSLDPVGPWDLMSTDQNPPQYSGAYMKNRYFNWLPSLDVIVRPGRYVLKPLTSETNNSYIIGSPNNNKEYFVVEYRKKTGKYESSIPSEGLVVYRVNKNFDGEGNADYNGNTVLDELYAYRYNGTRTVNGNTAKAPFSNLLLRPAFSATTNPSCFLSGGSDGGISISNITNYNDSVVFYVEKCALQNFITQYATSINPNSVILNATVNTRGEKVDVYFEYGIDSVNTTSVLASRNYSTNSDSPYTYKVSTLRNNSNYKYRLRIKTSTFDTVCNIVEFKTTCPSFSNITKPYGINEPCNVSAPFTYVSEAVGNYSYLWNVTPANAAVLTTNKNYVDAVWSSAFTGNATISYNVIDDNCTSSLSPLLTVNVKPYSTYQIEEKSPYLKGSSILIAPDSGRVKYQWYYSGFPVQNENKQFMQINPSRQKDWYYVASTTAENCQIQSARYDFSSSNNVLAASETMNNQLRIFPSQASTSIQLQSTTPTTIPMKILISDISGKVLNVIRVEPFNYVSNPIDIERLPKGYYVVRGENGNSIYFGKFIKN